ncbi:MAG: hypothetical protein ACI8P9_003388, partial [Parasphingorhabdus sp.]
MCVQLPNGIAISVSEVDSIPQFVQALYRVVS